MSVDSRFIVLCLCLFNLLENVEGLRYGGNALYGHAPASGVLAEAAVAYVAHGVVYNAVERG